MTTFVDPLCDLAFAGAMRATGRLVWKPFRHALERPCQTQEALLARILARQARTEFGERYGFRRIRGLADFQRAVPVSDYEALRPLIVAQAERGRRTLTADAPVFYNRTSGTTGSPKLIPVTPEGLRQLGSLQRLFTYGQYRHAATFAGRILAIAGTAVEDRTSAGVPVGSASGLLYAAMPGFVRRRYVVPHEILGITDYDLRDYLVALLGIAAANVSALATANPSTLGRLLRVIRERWDPLLDDLAHGTPQVAASLGPDQRSALAARLRPDPARARSLRRRMGPNGPAGFDALWPELKSVVTWTGGCCGYALATLLDTLPAGCRAIDLGYHASECRGTINIDPRRNACVPALTSTVFEFVEREARDRGTGCFLGLDEIELGRDYYVYVTTVDGLYRYDMNDIVRVTDCVGATPTLAFVQKGRGVTSITGEKLSEEQVLGALASAAHRAGVERPFFLMLADETAAAYELHVEAPNDAAAGALALSVEAALMADNIEYACKRRSDRLRPIRAHALRHGTGEAYRRHCVERGQRDAQYKPQHLQYRRDCRFDLASHRAAGDLAA